MERYTYQNFIDDYGPIQGKEEEWAQELFDWIENNYELYKHKLAFWENYTKKMKRGVYNHNLAVKGLLILAEVGAKHMYKQMFSGYPLRWFDILTPTVRKITAEMFADQFEDDYENRSYDFMAEDKKRSSGRKQKEVVVDDRDLTKLTDSKREEVIDYLVSLPLKELRKRQDLVRSQQERAYKSNNERALNNLEVMDDLLMLAVDKKEFGKEASIEEESLFSKVKRLGIPYDHHETDLYIPVTRETRELLSGYKHKQNVTTFQSEVEGSMWFDIPFGYDLWWDDAETQIDQWVKGKNANIVVLSDITLTKLDKRVLMAFIDQKSGESKRLTSDGERLDGNWLGGNKIAYWVDGKMEFGEGRPHGRSDQTIIRFLRKNTPKFWLKEKNSARVRNWQDWDENVEEDLEEEELRRKYLLKNKRELMGEERRPMKNRKKDYVRVRDNFVDAARVRDWEEGIDMEYPEEDELRKKLLLKERKDQMRGERSPKPKRRNFTRYRDEYEDLDF